MGSLVPDIVISGLGVTSSIGQGRGNFLEALLAGRHAFGKMRRPGRQWPLPGVSRDDVVYATAFLGAEIAELSLPNCLPAGILRTASLTAQVAVTTLHEAWYDAKLENAAPASIGLLVAGSNLQQREIVLAQGNADDRRFRFLRPTYALTFLDTDICGLCSEIFGIHGFAFTLGAASASGLAAVIQAVDMVRTGQIDICIAMGALMDLSCWELQSLQAIGAMGSDRFADDPAAACRPFDTARDGFIYGENCAALVIETAESAARRGAVVYARVAGWAYHSDGNRDPNPSIKGEMAVIARSLACAGWKPDEIDYVNPHGTGSPIGDDTEIAALRQSGLAGAQLNTSKSICGHGISAAGAVELAGTLLQMRAGRLHPSRNIDNSIAPDLCIVRNEPIDHTFRKAIKLSFGFGGVNTALCLEAA
jgi:malonyl-ACP decarboxylase